ncbi:MAG TPA: helix-turn-helix domain-containing protein [Candidatus Binatus sp.]|uniref:helix-turn-helix domain-containing protein n=1 Tax=Candidatus Binatus sp. TaxID=2811406 RepID=UPI002B4863BB|nr:helix-turn-helix domain-containing protein [Candidatus Binatus sp.]HKN13983.1 helix-turn-helix domain-containing protein [Candidatus Binatus sp.]
MSDLHAIPTLDELAADPKRATGLPRAALSALLRRSAVAQSVLVAELECAQDQPAAEPAKQDEWIKVDEAAAILRHGRQWIYRNAKHLPFVKRISRKSLLCSRNGILRWLERRTA